MSIFSKLKELSSKNKTVTSVIAISLACIVGISAQYVTKKKDGFAEQAAEKVLQSYGLDIDFSPEIASD